MDNISENNGNELLILERALSNALDNVIGTMSGMTLDRSEFNKPGYGLESSQIVGIMLLTGDTNALLAITMSLETASTLVSFMTGIMPEELNSEEVYDGVSELVNMISGSAKSLLKDTLFRFKLTTPITVVGENHLLVHKGKGNKISINFIYGNLELNLVFILL